MYVAPFPASRFLFEFHQKITLRLFNPHRSQKCSLTLLMFWNAFLAHLKNVRSSMRVSTTESKNMRVHNCSALTCRSLVLIVTLLGFASFSPSVDAQISITTLGVPYT